MAGSPTCPTGPAELMADSGLCLCTALRAILPLLIMSWCDCTGDPPCACWRYRSGLAGGYVV